MLGAAHTHRTKSEKSEFVITKPQHQQAYHHSAVQSGDKQMTCKHGVVFNRTNEAC